MSLLLPLGLTLTLMAPLPSGGPAALGSTAELSADVLTYEPGHQVLVARGHAVLRSADTVLRADTLTYDQARDRAEAQGHVLFVSGLTAAVAESLTVDLSAQEATLQGGLLLQKRGVSPERLKEATTAEELKTLGETTVALTGQRIQRLGRDEYAVEGLSFTPCDCNPASPSWHIEARHAEVKVGEHVVLTFPVVSVYSVPVLAAPWLDLPLSDRRTGLLIPRPSTSSATGFAIEQPFFITLGRSYDVTLTPGYFFGARKVTVTDPATSELVTDPETGVPLRFSPALGVQGPRLLTEFRYAPSATTHGRINLGLLYDLRPVRDPVDPSPLLADPNRVRGLRGDLLVQHVQQLGGGFQDRLDATFVSDGYYVRDLTTDVLQREDTYLRTSGAVFHRDADSYAGLEVTLRQLTRYGYSLFDADRTAAGTPVYGPNTFHRLPTLRYALPERPLFGSPLFGGFTAEYTRLAPLLSQFGDEGMDGIFDPAHPDSGQGDRRYTPGEREARDRLDLRPRLSTSLSAGPFLRFTPSVAWRQDFSVGEITGSTSQRGYPLLSALLETELSRTFQGAAPALEFRHAIRPWLELRWVPRVFGAAPAMAYDEVDAAVPGDGLLQAMVHVSQRLWLRQGTSAQELLRLDLGQGVDLQRGLLGDTAARLGVALGPVRADAVARYNAPLGRFTQVAATCTLDDGQGDALYGRYDRGVTRGSDRIRRGVDMLFGTPTSLGDDAEVLVAGARASFRIGLTAFYEATVQPLRSSDKLVQQKLGLGWSPACDCWRLDVSASLHPGNPVPDFGFNLTLARFGSLGAGG